MPPGTTQNNSFDNIVAGAPGHVFIASQNNSAQLPARLFIMPLPQREIRTYATESFNADEASPRFTSVALDSTDDPSYAGQGAPTEGEALVAMTPRGEGWVTWTRGKDGTAPLVAPGENGVFAARMVRS